MTSSDPPPPEPARPAPDGVTQTAEHWGRMARTPNEQRGDVNWLDSPLVQRLYIHPTISGHPEGNWLEYFKRRHLPHTVSRGLTIGCGSGGLERHAAHLRLCEQHDAFDISPEAVAIAAEAAAKAGLDHVSYGVRDLNHATFEAGSYDVVFCSMALHHIENLEHLYEQVRGALRPGGLFVFNEYVGPDRFQWTRRQLWFTNRILGLLPERLRRRVTDGLPKPPVERPTVQRMIEVDPSEAVRSSDILPLLAQHFRVVDRIEYGGTLLHLLLEDIAGNFRADRPADVRILRRIFALERTLIRSRVLPSDFVLVVAQPA